MPKGVRATRHSHRFCYIREFKIFIDLIMESVPGDKRLERRVVFYEYTGAVRLRAAIAQVINDGEANIFRQRKGEGRVCFLLYDFYCIRFPIDILILQEQGIAGPQPGF